MNGEILVISFKDNKDEKYSMKSLICWNSTKFNPRLTYVGRRLPSLRKQIQNINFNPRPTRVGRLRCLPCWATWTNFNPRPTYVGRLQNCIKYSLFTTIILYNRYKIKAVQYNIFIFYSPSAVSEAENKVRISRCFYVHLGFAPLMRSTIL